MLIIHKVSNNLESIIFLVIIKNILLSNKINRESINV